MLRAIKVDDEVFLANEMRSLTEHDAWRGRGRKSNVSRKAKWKTSPEIFSGWRTYLRRERRSIIHQSHGTILTSGPTGMSPFRGKGVIADRSVFEYPREIRTARRASMEYEGMRGRCERGMAPSSADTIPKESGSISEAVTSAERAPFLGNRKLRQSGGKRRQSNYALSSVPSILPWNFIPLSRRL